MRQTGMRRLYVALRGWRTTLAKAHGFTLVELLVMIALVCIVLAMLLPLLQGAMLTARLTSCAGNLKQFSAAFTMYADDYNGHMPAPWNRGFTFVLRDAWHSDPMLPMGLAVFFRDNYLTDGKLVLCPDMIPSAGSAERTWPGTVVDSLEIVRTTGRFSTDCKGYHATYTVNYSNSTPFIGESSHAWDWPNYADYYSRLGLASRLSGNLPGGRNHNAGNNATARIRSPRPYMACGFPTNNNQSHQPHQMNSFHTLFADGMIQRVFLDYGTRELLRARTVPASFRDVIAGMYPDYRPPQ